VTSVLVGVHVHAEPDRLLATLRALAGPSRRRHDVLLLPDGPDRPTRRALAALDLPRSTSQEPLGPPACFNRLAAASDAEVVILLESGSVPGPSALDRLVDALERDPSAGLAGPSTNSAWNEQCLFPRAGGGPADVARTARQAAQHYGSLTRTLEPLHNLADFCLAVRRETIEAIGGADEGYGLGPCWEMEYGIRAARAGFRGLWVCGAYVWRAPFTTRRQGEEHRRFEASRRRYQDSVCALRLRGERDEYEPHCRGEECEHFAPRELITLRRPLVAAAPEAPVVPRVSEPPIVSCVMPTRNRAEFALHAVRLFQRQDWERSELLVVDDGDDDLERRLPSDPRIRYLRAPRGESIGAKRNRACGQARGAFIAQWDDDDWYGSRRLSVQVAPLLAGRADMTGLLTPIFFELEGWRFWTCSPPLHRRLFTENVHGGTLVFARRVWDRLARYPNASLAEDAAFLLRARARGARLERVDGRDVFVYVRHGRNSWRFRCGEYLDRGGWQRAPEPPFPPEDRAFYAARSPAAGASGQPLVSCLMPTADRRAWVANAIEYFLRQDYPNRELLVLDDGEDRIADLVPADPRIRYVPLDRRLVLGEKRNRACELARGEIVLHWDDDDWQAPHRVRYQVEELERHGAAICGPTRVLHFDPAAGQAWLYEYPARGRQWVAGNALCYRKEAWQSNRFAPVQVGEDTRFLWSPRAPKPLVLGDHRFFAALVHTGNTSRKPTRGAYWHPRPLEEVRTLLGADWSRYA
jgi:glycosyltransferase involved in cell wall biosynthesis